MIYYVDNRDLFIELKSSINDRQDFRITRVINCQIFSNDFEGMSRNKFAHTHIDFGKQSLGDCPLFGVNRRLQKVPQKMFIDVKSQYSGGQFQSPERDLTRPAKLSYTTLNVSRAIEK